MCPHGSTKYKCAPCRRHTRAILKEKRLANGMCSRCGQHSTKGGRITCNICADKQNERNHRMRKKLYPTEDEWINPVERKMRREAFEVARAALGRKVQTLADSFALAKLWDDQIRKERLK